MIVIWMTSFPLKNMNASQWQCGKGRKLELPLLLLPPLKVPLLLQLPPLLLPLKLPPLLLPLKLTPLLLKHYLQPTQAALYYRLRNSMLLPPLKVPLLLQLPPLLLVRPTNLQAGRKDFPPKETPKGTLKHKI